MKNKEADNFISKFYSQKNNSVKKFQRYQGLISSVARAMLNLKKKIEIKKIISELFGCIQSLLILKK